MPNEQSTQSSEPQQQVTFIIPWAEKRTEFGSIIANEQTIAQAWDMNENLIFFFFMWLGTY
jgi:hypothetical protein